MPWAWVQGATGHTVTSNLSVPLGSNVIAGHLVICSFTQYNVALQSSAVFDTVGPAFTFIDGYANVGGDNIDLELWYYIQPVTRALTVQVTSVSYIAMCVSEFAPPAGSVALVAHAHANGTGASPSIGPYAAGAGDLSVATLGVRADNAVIGGAAPYTVAESVQQVPSTNMGNLHEYRLSAPASDTAGGTVAPSSPWGMAIASFSPGGGGPGPSSVLLSDGCVPQPARRHRLKRHIHL